MTQQQLQHAEKIVAHFQDLIGEERSAAIGDDHFAELAILIESAIDASVLDAEERIVNQLQTLIDGIRKDAETFD